MESSDNQKLTCSFCGKNQEDVKKLIAGPSVYICDECVDLCNDIIEEEIKIITEENSKIWAKLLETIDWRRKSVRKHFIFKLGYV